MQQGDKGFQSNFYLLQGSYFDSFAVLRPLWAAPTPQKPKITGKENNPL